LGFETVYYWFGHGRDHFFRLAGPGVVLRGDNGAEFLQRY
jgi:hypothetical protein